MGQIDESRISTDLIDLGCFAEQANFQKLKGILSGARPVECWLISPMFQRVTEAQRLCWTLHQIHLRGDKATLLIDTSRIVPTAQAT
jgi:hypothetical protein